jgi:hypothetical protein
MSPSHSFLLLLATSLAAAACVRSDDAGAGGALVQLRREQLIQEVFQGVASIPEAKQKAAALLQAELDFVNGVTPLSTEQRSKLEFAGQGDIQRFFDAVERAIAEVPSGNFTRGEANAFRRRMYPFSMRVMAGLHGRASLFGKSVRSTLDAGQRSRYEESLATRCDEAYRKGVAMTVSYLCESQLSLDNDQRNRLTQLLLNHTRLPEPGTCDWFAHTYSLCALSRLPEKEVKDLVGERNWRTMSLYMQPSDDVRQFMAAIEDPDLGVVGRPMTP